MRQIIGYKWIFYDRIYTGGNLTLIVILPPLRRFNKELRGNRPPS
jgi:hypothetical protein